MGKRGSAAAPDPYYSSRLIHPSGPADSPGLLVGEAGGETEHRRQRPFSGKAGQVMDTYLRAAGIARPDVRVTNIYPFWTGPGNPDPTPEQVAEFEHLLLEEIENNHPRVIGAVGRVAARWFLGDVSIEQTNGIPHWSDRAPGAIILPIAHPAAGFYNPALASLSQEGFFRFAHYLRNPMPPRETPVIEVREVVDEPPYLEGAIDTEGMPNRPWGCSWSKDGKVTNVHISGKLTNTKIRGRVTFQNALHDLVVLRAMGVDTSTLDYDDTMVMLYNLQLEPQGLKPAAYRHLNLKMQDFDDVVRPHFNDVALDYYRQAMSHRYPKPRPYIEADWKARKWKLKKPWDAGRRIKAVLKSWDKDPVDTKLEKKWADLGDEMQEQVQCQMKEDFPEFSIFEVPRDRAVQYSGIDAAATALLKPVLLAQLEAKGLLGVYEMDRRYLPFVDKMQETGMRVEVPRLKELEGHLEGIREAAKDKVQRIVGDRWFNPGSDDQVGRWLYKVQGLPILKYTEGGDGSTSAVTMKMIQGYYGRDRPEVMEFTKGIREYRESDKYLGTFVLPIFYYMKRDKRGDWRLHPRFKVTRVVSGRNSSADPNVMAFPTRTALGAMIRRCFVAADGYTIVSVDASQIELRTMAHHCRDRRMRGAFENDEDLHALTASIIFRIPLDKVTKVQRYVAKTLNFAIMYGISAKALLEQMFKADIFDYTIDDCKRFISEWFKIYGSVRIFLESVWKSAEKNGYVRDMWGRIAYVPNLRVGDDQMREAARRLAGNMPIQGGARGLVKRAETRCHDWFREQGLYQDDVVRPWLDLHDEVDLEVREDHAEEIAREVVGFFQADQELFRVPIKAESGIGRSWAEAK